MLENEISDPFFPSTAILEFLIKELFIKEVPSILESFAKESSKTDFLSSLESETVEEIQLAE